jgi:hypothetical protein
MICCALLRLSIILEDRVHIILIVWFMYKFFRNYPTVPLAYISFSILWQVLACLYQFVS